MKNIRNKSALFGILLFGMLLAANMVFHFTPKNNTFIIFMIVFSLMFLFNKNKKESKDNSFTKISNGD